MQKHFNMKKQYNWHESINKSIDLLSLLIEMTAGHAVDVF